MADGIAQGIQPNSQYDQTIEFPDYSDSYPGDDAPNPGQFSPRPGINTFGNSDSNDLGDNLGGTYNSIGGGYGLSSPTDFQGSGNFNSGNFGGADYGLGGDGIGGSNGNFGNYSPRPNETSSPELAQLFGLISNFQPPPIEITPHFKPFLPDLVPAIGAIDAFIKVPRPDDEFEALGLTVLDEPTIGCSDPQIIKMQLREKYGIVSNNEGDGYIGSIEDLDNNQKALDTFLENYEEMIRDRPAPSIVYSYKMPDLDDLLVEWPPELDKALRQIPLPSADMDLTTEEYAKIICAFLDIPVKGNIIESLHVFFTLFMMFEENQHFPVNDNNSLRNDKVESLDLDNE